MTTPGYGRWFDNPSDDLMLSGDLIIEMDHLSPEQKGVVIAWVKAHADRAAAEAKLRDVLKQALFDVTAAELGALLHKPGNA